MKVEDAYARMSDVGEWAASPLNATLSPASPELSHKLDVALKKVCCTPARDPSHVRIRSNEEDGSRLPTSHSTWTFSGGQRQGEPLCVGQAARRQPARARTGPAGALISSPPTVVNPVPRVELMRRWKP